MLLKSNLSNLRIDEINDSHAQGFAAQLHNLSASGINRGLRTLRYSLNKAYQWNTLERPAKVNLVTGEVQRDRILTEAEAESYLGACPQPWRDAATIILDEGMRPGEVFALDWANISLDEGSSFLRITEGKSKAARRMLPLTPRVHGLLLERHRAAGTPSAGWIFPSNSWQGHFNSDCAKDQHRIALRESGVRAFEPYILRHTGLTRIAIAAGHNPFVVMKIAGHSTLTMTQRYCHAQADDMQRAFAALEARSGGTEILRGKKGGTKGGTVKKRLSGTRSKRHPSNAT